MRRVSTAIRLAAVPALEEDDLGREEHGGSAAIAVCHYGSAGG